MLFNTMYFIAFFYKFILVLTFVTFPFFRSVQVNDCTIKAENSHTVSHIPTICDTS